MWSWLPDPRQLTDGSTDFALSQGGRIVIVSDPALAGDPNEGMFLMHSFNFDKAREQRIFACPAIVCSQLPIHLLAPPPQNPPFESIDHAFAGRWKMGGGCVRKPIINDYQAHIKMPETQSPSLFPSVGPIVKVQVQAFGIPTWYVLPGFPTPGMSDHRAVPTLYSVKAGRRVTGETSGLCHSAFLIGHQGQRRTAFRLLFLAFLAHY
ncbi:uncharacterized protein BO88DRAFT_417274 [Aspergillus vadensis CBS 113365]|uniref:Uncharacterized protein n=1 Tax=Aspergillus vadensis (strain CBS 113365 / IMI 142717 / IBT 24658) TaxID=1448311 RepID=A0A319BML0_ASPVC|nr:hypothetical protein BO88DRAFT_417274 [Aspergillus vadensis CBS 113365]PYH66933.1 hypothetical protein BO88DRAFT_417274 [Aspergillus vadensis CBS 113365]